MEKSPQGINSTKDLLARVFGIFSAVPYSVACLCPQPRFLLVRVPISSGRNYFGRARESKGRPVMFIEPADVDFGSDSLGTSSESSESSGGTVESTDSEEAVYSKIATGPGKAPKSVALENLRRLRLSGHESMRLKVLRARGACEFGALSNGHVLGGTGIVKEVIR